MGTDLLSDIRREIDARLRELRPALQEYEDLLQAADALGLDAPHANGTAPRRRGGRARAGVRAEAPSAGRAECEAILGALEHGSHTVGELVVVTAMSAASINGYLRRLAGRGLIAKTEREGKTAWSLTAAG
jgi:predicted transcriptional regulator